MVRKRAWAVLALWLPMTSACGGNRGADMVDFAPDGPADGTTGGEAPPQEPEERLDAGSGDPSVPLGCQGDADCELIDVLFVIDNSGTMGEEQLNLAANFPRLVQRLQNLEKGGVKVNADVNIMVTTTDLGHPLCTEFQRDGYAPAQGAPIYTGCNSRIESFSSEAFGEVEIPEACTKACPNDVLPGGDPFIHFGPAGTNVPGGEVASALSCVAPQGIDGCGYEAPLEAMLQALRPGACWNEPGSTSCTQDESWSWVANGFLRPSSTLAIAIITDEADCSVASPNGYSFFTDADNREYWLEEPDSGQPMPSSAVCWGAGVQCTDENEDGIYESCESRSDDPALHPVSRYVEFLNHLQTERFHNIVMLGILGVPPVTAHAEDPPFGPTEGGVEALEYRDWRGGVFDGSGDGDILPEDWERGVTAADKQFEFGIGPGCTGTTTDTTDPDAEGPLSETFFTGQAIPPVRIREVCESLNGVNPTGAETVRCCIESICDDDFSPAIDCLAGIIADAFPPEG